MVMLDLFTGGALSNFSVFALGIMPYITASIIMQLMQGVIPAVGRWAKEGETGRRRITQVTRYLTLGLGLINAIGYLFLFKSEAYGVVFSTAVPEIVTDILVVFTLVVGTALIMWMGVGDLLVDQPECRYGYGHCSNRPYFGCGTALHPCDYHRGACSASYPN